MLTSYVIERCVLVMNGIFQGKILSATKLGLDWLRKAVPPFKRIAKLACARQLKPQSQFKPAQGHIITILKAGA